MSEYKTIECECGKVFVTKEFMCKCPRCGKTHYNTSGGALVIGIVLLLLVLIAVMLGALAWLGYAQSNKKSHWHYIGAIGLGSVAIWIGENAWRHDSSGWADVCLLLNGLAILAAIIFLVKLYKNRNVTEAAPNTEALVTESG